MGDKSVPNRDWSGTGRKENVNGKQTLTENKIESKRYKELPKNKPKMGRPGPSRPRRPRGEVEGMTPTESLGVMATGGWKGKPHSSKEGRIASGQRKLTRFFYGRK